MNIIKARKIIGNKIIGITCHNSIKLAKAAVKEKANYIAFGAFFSTKTKKVKHIATTKILNKVKNLELAPKVLYQDEPTGILIWEFIPGIKPLFNSGNKNYCLKSLGRELSLIHKTSHLADRVLF
mgnify:CR=1 FL=1